MGLTWNSWYNVLDNAANIAHGAERAINNTAVGRAVNGVTSVAPGETTPGVTFNTSGIKSTNPTGGKVQGVSTVTQAKSGDAQVPDLDWSQLNSQWNGTGGTGGASGSGGSDNGYDPASVAQIDYGIENANNSLGLLDQESAIGQENINNGYQSSLQTLLDAFGRTQRDYNDTRDQTLRDNVEARQSIQTDTGRNANALQRLLRGNSSASQIVAPYAAALQGSQRMQGVTKNFGQNMSGLDKNWNDYSTDWQKNRQGLDTQKFQQEQSLRSDSASKRQSLLSQLAQLHSQRAAAQGGNSAAALAAAQPYMSQVNAIAPQLINYGRQYANAITAKAPEYKQADLSSYDYAKMNVPNARNSSSYTDTVNPIFRSLLSDEDKKNQIA